MNDTSPTVEARYRSMLLRRSGPERLRMACEMFDAAQAMALAELTARGLVPNEAHRTTQLALRFYLRDLGPLVLGRLTAKLILHHTIPVRPLKPSVH